MKILLDECTPHVLKKLLTEFEVKTVQDQGWSGTTNGALIRLAEGKFDVLITSDQSLKYQQQLVHRQLSIIQLPTNQISLVTKLTPRILEALASIRAGEFVELSLDDRIAAD